MPGPSTIARLPRLWGLAVAAVLASGVAGPASATTAAPKGKKAGKKKAKPAPEPPPPDETEAQAPEPDAPEPPPEDPASDDSPDPEPVAPEDATDVGDGDDEDVGQSDITSPAASAPARVDAQKVAGLEAEARAVEDELFKARARVATVASKLFRAKLQLRLRSNLARFYEVSDLVIAVDGAPVVTQASGVPSAADELFALFAAPGAHELSFSANLVARRDATYKLRIQQTFTVLVPEDSTVSTKLLVRETGNMWRFAKRNRGHSAVRVTLRARAKPNARGRGRSRAGAKGSVSASGGTP